MSPAKKKRLVVITRDPLTGNYIARTPVSHHGLEAMAKGEGSTIALAVASCRRNVAVVKERAELAKFREEIEVDW